MVEVIVVVAAVVIVVVVVVEAVEVGVQGMAQC